MKKMLVALVLVGIYVPAWALSVGEIKTEVRRYIEDNANPRIKYTDDLIYDLINQGHRDFVNQTWALMARDSQSITSGTAYYNLRSDAFAIRLVQFRNSAGVVTELTELSERGLVQDNPDYERQTGVPTQYFVRYSTSGASALQIGFLPKPNVSGTVLVDYYIQAPDLTAASDIPYAGYRILYPYHEALAYYAIARLKMMEGELEEGAFYMGLYGNAAKAAIDRLGRMPNYNPGFSAGGK